LKCGEKDHRIAVCPRVQPAQRAPQIGQSSGANQKPQVKARVDSLTEQEAKANNDVVAGIIIFWSANARVLLNSGALRSFIATEFVKTHNFHGTNYVQTS